MKTMQKLYVVLALIMLSVPLFMTPFFPTTETTEAAKQAPAPQIMEDGHLNERFVTDAGDWFSDHYAFRQQLITANSLISTELFRTSPVHSVVLGSDDWLFYADTMGDYTGRSLFNERQMNCLVHNLQLMQWSAKSQNAQFVLMIAPNKNSIYPEQMPAAYPGAKESNLVNVQEALVKAGVNVCDVRSPLLSSKEEGLYYHRDSHWNRQGALIAYDSLMSQLGLSSNPYASMPSLTVSHTGDLDEILLPKAWKAEEEKMVDENMNYTPRLEGDALMDEWIETDNPQGDGSILLFRDSFGINLVPYLADTFEKGWFSRLEPYNFIQISTLQPQIVAIEKAERNIREFFEEVPIMYMPSVKIEPNQNMEGSCTISSESSGDFIRLHGRIDADNLEPESEIYLRMQDPDGKNAKTCAVFYICSDTSDYEFELCLPKDMVNAQTDYTVLVRNRDVVSALHAEQSGKE